MEKIWLLVFTVLIFLAMTFLYWKITKRYAEKETGKKMWNTWTARTYYWTGAVWYSGGATALVLVLLKSTNILTF